MLEVYRLYLLVEGMPATVVAYLNTNNLNVVAQVQRDIVEMYRKNISKYDEKDKLNMQGFLAKQSVLPEIYKIGLGPLQGH